MNLKKISWITVLAPMMALSACRTMPLNRYGEWEPDEILLQNIWKEAVRITEIDPNAPPPKIEFLERNDPENLGMFFPEYPEHRIEIYLGGVTEIIWRVRGIYQRSGGTRGCDMSYIEGMAYIYNSPAHEMLHSALEHKGVLGTLEQHRQMKEKYLLPILSYINDYFKINAGFKSNRNGCQVDLSMKSLEKTISNDEKRTKLK